MDIRYCAKADYDEIISQIEDFWGSDRTIGLHHSMFIYEFGHSAFVIKDGDRVAAYLLGFFSQMEPAAYVHLVGVRTAYRRLRMAWRLYDHFAALARRRGCTEMRVKPTTRSHAN
jgi:GNAT superfamily N-acetyltransferase